MEESLGGSAARERRCHKTTWREREFRKRMERGGRERGTQEAEIAAVRGMEKEVWREVVDRGKAAGTSGCKERKMGRQGWPHSC